MPCPRCSGAKVPPTMQLLLVEDDPTMQATLQRALARRGMDVTAVGDGRSALARWTDLAPMLITMAKPQLINTEK